MKFCTHCGHELSWLIPAGDNRERHVCSRCESVHYQNPRIIAGCLAELDGRILLCKRAIEPRAGWWTLPAGFLENGETTAEGALREMLEEANARGSDPCLYTLFSLPHISQVYMFYRARLSDLAFSAGAETTDVRLFSQEEIPWGELAFPVITQTIQFYFEDLPRGEFPIRARDIIYPNRTPHRH